MEWSRAKSIVIIFLVILNVMLSAILLIERERDTLSAQQERNIVEVLYANNIVINAPLIRRTPPVRMLELSPGVIDDELMMQVFLGTVDAVRSDEGGNIRSHYYEGSRIIIYANQVIFESGAFEEFKEIDFDIAKRMSDDFLAGLGDMGRGFVLDVGPYSSGNEIIVEYRQRIEGVVIYNNYFLFAIDNYGIRRVEYSQSMPVGFSSSLNEICLMDEALFSFLRAMRMESIDRPRRVIEKIDIVYFMDFANAEQGMAYPYFRIYYREFRPDGSYVMRLRMINAYFGTWRF